MRNVLVTGGTGFIGSNLVQALLKDGSRVRILRRATSDLRAVSDLDVEHRIGDLRDRASLRDAMKGCDTVFHTAALVSYWRRQRNEMFDINIGGTRNVVDTCLEAGVEKLVHTSSIAAIGFAGNDVLADETSPFNWDSYDIGYRISKFKAEQEVLRGVRQGLPAVIVNPSVVIGERDIHFNGGQIVRDVHRKRIFYYVNGGTSIVYVGDVVQGHLEAARRGRIGERYILGGENLTHRELVTVTAGVVGGIRPLIKLPMWLARTLANTAETIGALSHSKPWITRELVAGIDLCCWFSCEKARREFGYSVTPVRIAIERAFQWYKEHKML